MTQTDKGMGTITKADREAIAFRKEHRLKEIIILDELKHNLEGRMYEARQRARRAEVGVLDQDGSVARYYHTYAVACDNLIESFKQLRENREEWA